MTNLKHALELGLGSNTALASIFRFRFYTSLSASTDEEFDAAAQDFVTELEHWRMHFASWVGIATSQDLVGLGGNTDAFTSRAPISTWTSNANGKRARYKEWEFDTHRNQIEDRSWSYTASKRARPLPATMVRLLRNGCSFAMRVPS